VARKEIRLQYTGYVIFAAKLLSIATGLAFQIMVARAASKSEYDIFFNIGDVLAYFMLFGGVVPFWVMRCVTRGKEGATKTGLATNLIFAAISTILYIALIPIILPLFNIPAAYLPVYLIVAAQITELYLIGIFEPCLQAYSPQKVGYGLLFQQSTKVVLGYILIVQLGQPLVGAMVATIVSFAIQLAYYYKLLANELKQRIHWGYMKEWLKGSVASIYSVIGGQIAAFVFLLLFTLGGEGSRGIYGAAAQIASVIAYAGFLSFALYPKLLAEKKSEDITSSMKTVLMFALPMTVGAVALAGSFMLILRPEYMVEYPGVGSVLIILAIDTFVGVISGFYASVLFGVENVDQGKMTIKTLAKSKIFLSYTLSYVHSAVTIPTTYYVLTTYAFQQPLQAALSVCIINAVMRFAMFIVIVYIVHGMVKITVPWKSIAKYAAASAVMGTVLLLLPYSTRFYTTLAWTAIGGGVYLGVLLLIDKETRALPRDVLKEIRGRKNQASKT
jgi:O-antigen/teichoic acid export membrane protein